MPEGGKFDRCVEHVEKQGGSANPYAVCTASTGENRKGEPSKKYKKGGKLRHPKKKGKSLIDGTKAIPRANTLPPQQAQNIARSQGQRKIPIAKPAYTNPTPPKQVSRPDKPGEVVYDKSIISGTKGAELTPEDYDYLPDLKRGSDEDRNVHSYSKLRQAGRDLKEGGSRRGMHKVPRSGETPPNKFRTGKSLADGEKAGFSEDSQRFYNAASGYRFGAPNAAAQHYQQQDNRNKQGQKPMQSPSSTTGQGSKPAGFGSKAQPRANQTQTTKIEGVAPYARISPTFQRGRFRAAHNTGAEHQSRTVNAGTPGPYHKTPKTQLKKSLISDSQAIKSLFDEGSKMMILCDKMLQNTTDVGIKSMLVDKLKTLAKELDHLETMQKSLNAQYKYRDLSGTDMTLGERVSAGAQMAANPAAAPGIIKNAMNKKGKGVAGAIAGGAVGSSFGPVGAAVGAGAGHLLQDSMSSTGTDMDRANKAYEGFYEIADSPHVQERHSRVNIHAPTPRSYPRETHHEAAGKVREALESHQRGESKKKAMPPNKPPRPGASKVRQAYQQASAGGARSGQSGHGVRNAAAGILQSQGHKPKLNPVSR